MEKVLRQYIVLAKPGIVFGNLLTMVAGFAMGSKGVWNWGLCAWTLLGLTCIIMSASVWNNYIDRDLDKKMARTEKRPLATGTISLTGAKGFASGLCLVGVTVLLGWTNVLATFAALFGFIIYVFGYSFAKYRFAEATFVGAIAGAAPPVVGYAAACGRIDFTAFLLFLMLLFWQMPHFFAIAIYRLEDYRRARIPLLPLQQGIRVTKFAMVFYLLGFMAVTFVLAPYAIIVNVLWFILCLSGFKTKNDTIWARKMFLFSLIVITAVSAELSCASSSHPVQSHFMNRNELYEVFLGKKDWQVEGAAALTEALPKEGLFSVIEENFGAIILAGGRGTRLGVQGPKGCVEVEGKSLFEHLLSKARDPRLWVAIMTSPDNHEETKRFLQAHDWFGVDPSHIDLFVQSTAPVLSRDGRWLEQETPSGNGAIFHTFREHGLLQKWKNLGISAVNILPIDNPKADPADTTCFALPEELVVKVVAQISPEEKVGRMVTKSGRLFVQEYFELSPEQKEAGAFCYAGMFSCSLSFLERAASLKLPWHLVQKDNHFQFETFIFDAFSVARSFSLVHYPRSLFVPIKSMADLQAKG